MSPIATQQPAIAPLSRFDAIFLQYWYYAAVVLFFLWGLASPGAGLWMKAVNATPYLVALAFFLNGFTLSTTSLITNLRHWPLLLAAMALTFLVAPGVVLLARQVLPGGDSLLGVGFQMLAVVPTTLVTAVVLTRVAHGNGAIALYISVMANILAIMVIPPIVFLTLHVPGVQLDVVGMTASLLITVFLPTLAGQALRRLWRDWAVAHQRLLGTISQLTVLFFILSGMAALPRHQLTAELFTLVILLGVIFHIVLLVIADLSGRLLRADRPTRHALSFSTAQKSLVLSLFLFNHLFGSAGSAFGLVVLPAIGFYLVELVIDSMLAQWLGRGHTATA